MSFRRNREKSDQQRKWNDFCLIHSASIQFIGFSEYVIGTEERFLDFLMHGYLDHHDDPTHYSVNQMSQEQHAAFLDLAKEYMKEYGQLGEGDLIALKLARF